MVDYYASGARRKITPEKCRIGEFDLLGKPLKRPVTNCYSPLTKRYQPFPAIDLDVTHAPYLAPQAAPIRQRAAREIEKGNVMKKIAALSAITAVLAIGTIADAYAWERKSTRTGPHGTATYESNGSCAGRACSRSVIKTTPYGNTFTRDGDASCADGSCSGSRTTTGPRGETVTRSRSISK